MRKALVIGFDESLEVIDLDAPEGSLEVIKNVVDGWVEPVYLLPNETMWVNEEGKLDGLPPNSIATSIFQVVFGKVDIIMGNAVITGGSDDKGETLGMTEERIAKYQKLFG
jgi:hypothetical protein